MNATPVGHALNGGRRSGRAPRSRLLQGTPRSIDRRALEAAAGDLLISLGVDLSHEGLRGTPRRMADAYAELLTPAPISLATFANEEGYDELVVVRDIPFPELAGRRAR
jgi:GTP cyclohydrolase I